MDYLKFNCYDLASQNTELYSVYSKIQQLSDEFDAVISSLDPQIKSCTDLQKQFAVSRTETDDVSARVLSAHNSLDQIIDIYYSAENKALRTSEDLPASIAEYGDEKRTKVTVMALPSSVNNGDLILEDWLAELLYKHSKDNTAG